MPRLPGTGCFDPASGLATAKRLASWAALGHTKAIEKRYTESTGQHSKILFMVVKTGVATMARPDPKPFDPTQVKSESEYAKDALKDANFATETGKGHVNRGEDLSDTAGAARHTITDTVRGKKGS